MAKSSIHFLQINNALYAGYGLKSTFWATFTVCFSPLASSAVDDLLKKTLAEEEDEEALGSAPGLKGGGEGEGEDFGAQSLRLLNITWVKLSALLAFLELRKTCKIRRSWSRNQLGF